jgi:outer membrane lipoprotein LolB
VIRRCAAAAILLLTGGCATLPSGDDTGDWPADRTALQALDHWTLGGRIAVAAGEDGFSGGFDWVQTGQQADIGLSGPVGGPAMQIRIQGDRIDVSVPGREANAEDGHALLARYFGPDRALPAAQMRYWLLGVPAPDAPAEETLGADRRLTALTQSGWLVRFERYQGVGPRVLPARMEMKAPGLRLRIVVSEWQLPP